MDACSTLDREQALTERQRQAEIARRWRAYETLVQQRGQRYNGARLSNFRIEHEGQGEVVEALRGYADDLRTAVDQGEGVVLFGARGTGKDHLVMALAGIGVVKHGLTVRWINGADLWGDLRDGIDARRPERELVATLTAPDVLYLSDPLPPSGALTEYQAGFLFRVLDRRYSRNKPLWVTLNVSGRRELDDRFGSQLADRLVDGALCLHCAWPSYRRPKTAADFRPDAAQGGQAR